jgi:hypothetical protein
VTDEERVEHPGPYRGKRDDYQKLSQYWAARSRHFEQKVDELEDKIVELQIHGPEDES